MLMTVTPIPTPEPGSPYPQAPPPLLPKPGKENLRLQRLLKKAAKKAVPAPPPPKAYRSTLSPVSEASPDLEHCVCSPPPKTPETPKPLILSLPPRHFIKPVVHHVASPYPKHRSFTFSISEQRSISQCFRHTPSPTSPVSVLSKQVIPHIELQQPPQRPRAEPAVPSQIPSPSPGHSSSAIPEISEPKTPPSTTPALCNSVPEAPGQATHVTEGHTQVSSVQPIRSRTPISERDQRNRTPDHENRTPVSVAQPETSHSESPTKCSPLVVSTSVNRATTHKPTVTPTVVTLPSTPSDSAYEIPRATTPKATSAEAAVPRGSSPNSPIPRPETPNTQIPTPIIPGTTVSSPANSSDKTSKSLTETTKQEVTAMVPKCVVSKNDSSLNPNMTSLSIQGPPPQSPAAGNESRVDILPKAEPLLKSTEKVKPPKTKLSGWSRIKKHLVVEPEEPQFPVPESDAPRTKDEEEKKVEAAQKNFSTDNKVKPKQSRATKMWDAVLFQMVKESHKQANEREETKKDGEKSVKEVGIFSFRCRLPLLLFAPRFDARKLKEACSRPLKKITTMFDLGRLHRKTSEEEPKDFNRTASGWQLK
ncbi:pollen-specific leucine-rich repeat extensin-like protein 2 [Rhinatrema bivittatum]|uniref:pollen-specific leucine-rich repeat extensin-like protein 2 n=1 Tax=Rhinatrema bivittatum TaxID=194408 RepID=UPI00112B4005|nr:pollen-specific leucine-rich repeat extensin-like protein 2 [Rhinatrema bivittatum]XP_029437967.1 pollen-specific leucine-rich repeat extensin-like protein 2 [Rhinatrema bivittatum]